MKYNITQHALMRYLQRDLGESIVNDRTYETWKKTNENSESLIKSATENINKQISEANCELEGSFNQKKTPTKYIINLKEAAVYAIVDQNVVTYYEAKFENFYSKETNKKLLKALLEEFLEKQEKHDFLKKQTEFKKQINNKKIVELELEQKSKKTELQIIEEKLKAAMLDNDILTKELNSDSTILEIIKSRICKSDL